MYARFRGCVYLRVRTGGGIAIGIEPKLGSRPTTCTHIGTRRSRAGNSAEETALPCHRAVNLCTGKLQHHLRPLRAVTQAAFLAPFTCAYASGAAPRVLKQGYDMSIAQHNVVDANEPQGETPAAGSP
ncbi:hypothetical protein VTO73DRAFT_245 [Trametes versicolor]